MESQGIRVVKVIRLRLYIVRLAEFEFAFPPAEPSSMPCGFGKDNSAIDSRWPAVCCRNQRVAEIHAGRTGKVYRRFAKRTAGISEARQKATDA